MAKHATLCQIGMILPTIAYIQERRYLCSTCLQLNVPATKVDHEFGKQNVR